MLFTRAQLLLSIEVDFINFFIKRYDFFCCPNLTHDPASDTFTAEHLAQKGALLAAVLAAKKTTGKLEKFACFVLII
jgi:hypothetical protein